MTSKNNKTPENGFYASVINEFKEHKVSFAVYIVLRLLVLLMLVLQMLNGNFENAFLCVLTLVLFLVPAALQKVFRVELPSTLEIVVLFFIFSAEILGEISGFYTRFSHWDTVLHTLNGFLCAAIGFSLVDILNRNDRFHMELSPLFVAIVAFCFSMTIGVLWEFFEFFMDVFLGLDMQKDTIVHNVNSMLLSPGGKEIIKLREITSVAINGNKLGIKGYVDIGLTDTMEDLIVNFIGALVFSVAGFFYIKNRKEQSIITRFVPRRKEENNNKGKDGENP